MPNVLQCVQLDTVEPAHPVRKATAMARTAPVRAAVGKPVTVRLKNGRTWHGVLDPATDDARYAIQRAGRVDVVRRYEVEALVVREPWTL